MHRRTASLLALAVVLAVVVAGCATEPLVTPGVSTDTDVPPDDTATNVGDAADSMVVLADSGCPAPGKITPSDVPSGYQPAERANLNYTVDGDTAHFYLASGEKTVRFLYVDTEETNGAERSAFGEATKLAVDAMLRAAKDIMIAPRLKGGSPELDPFGRSLALVFVDGELLETRIIREGYSVYFASFGCAPPAIHSALVYAEAEANANNRGIWAPGHPKDYRPELSRWSCRPNPFTTSYCK